MCVGQNPLIRPLWMGSEETSGDSACRRIVAPFKKEVQGTFGLLSVSFTLIDRREKLISPEIRWIDCNDRLKRVACFGDTTKRIECLTQLSIHFTITRIFLRQPSELTSGLE